eukprot:4808858-Pleurochrysis_carterae.AAC.1
MTCENVNPSQRSESPSAIRVHPEAEGVDNSCQARSRSSGAVGERPIVREAESGVEGLALLQARRLALVLLVAQQVDDANWGRVGRRAEDARGRAEAGRGGRVGRRRRHGLGHLAQLLEQLGAQQQQRRGDGVVGARKDERVEQDRPRARL